MDIQTPAVEFAFEVIALCGPPQPIGQTPEGQVAMIPILSGSVEGPQIKGKVRPGGADWPSRRADNTMIIDARYEIETEDGVIIRVHNRGIAAGVGGMPRVRTHAQFIAPDGAYDWLNKAIFVGSVDVNPSEISKVFVRFYKLV